jgi:RNA polymerase subunit RPABC4/transcription elongation factor Spt4
MSMVAHYRYCPVCRSEYTLMATRCIDCEVDLVDEGELAALEEQVESFPPASELDCVRVAPLPWIRALSGSLQEDGIGHRVEPATTDDAPEDQRPDVFGDVQLFGLYVQSADISPAREIDGSIAGRLLPEEAPALAEDEEEACPACGTALTPDSVECPDCGLRFG